ncbi:PAS domain-containing sensor histidine kinase [Francisella sp. TX07-6608]|uniref:PAS domain-containing sensor histidine kinase n=1 Tax=Francisella sp. TX07-6608 TaxID=573568 RepID=UPI0008F992F2|nr:HAMP domain-containing sensor histidine kinase [Francisella sp. TX07-6608]OIN84955.1 sensory box protein [Francisella sp. TX07-6608]
MEKKLKIEKLENQIQLLQQVIDSIDANIYWKSVDGKFLGMNKKNLALIDSGLKHEDIIGKGGFDFDSSKQYEDKIHENDLEVIKSQKTLVVEEEYISTKKNKNSILLSTKSCLFNEKKEVIGLVGVSLDITKMKVLENQIKAQNEVKKHFIQNLTYNIQAPLKSLIKRIELLELINEEFGDKKISKIAKDIKKSSHVLENIYIQMREILNFQISHPKTSYNTVFRLDALIQNELEIAESLLKLDNNVNIHFVKHDNLCIEVYSDYYKLSQILRNLLSNAIKYTDRGNIWINTKINKINNIINFKLSIVDTGIGICENNLNNIFNLFNKDQVILNQNYYGIGIGLYIVKNNLNILNGKIQVESVLGQGSSFTIKIPLSLKS